MAFAAGRSESAPSAALVCGGKERLRASRHLSSEGCGEKRDSVPMRGFRKSFDISWPHGRLRHGGPSAACADAVRPAHGPHLSPHPPTPGRRPHHRRRGALLLLLCRRGAPHRPAAPRPVLPRCALPGRRHHAGERRLRRLPALLRRGDWAAQGAPPGGARGGRQSAAGGGRAGGGCGRRRGPHQAVGLPQPRASWRLAGARGLCGGPVPSPGARHAALRVGRRHAGGAGPAGRLRERPLGQPGGRAAVRRVGRACARLRGCGGGPTM